MTATTASRTAVHHRRHRRSRPLAAFDAAMDSPAAARSAATDVEQASTLGVPSTPRSSRTATPGGAQPVSQSTALIDKSHALS